MKASRILIAATLSAALPAMFALFPSTTPAAAMTCVPIVGGLYNCFEDGNDGGANRPGKPGNEPTPVPKPRNFKLTVTNHNFRDEPVTALVATGQVASGKVRICINNQKSGYREINLGQPGVGPFKLNGRNISNCATLPATGLPTTARQRSICARRP